MFMHLHLKPQQLFIVCNQQLQKLIATYDQIAPEYFFLIPSCSQLVHANSGPNFKYYLLFLFNLAFRKYWLYKHRQDCQQLIVD